MSWGSARPSLARANSNNCRVLNAGITNTGWGERHCSIVNELRCIILRCVNVEGRVTGEGNEAGRDLVAGVDAAYKV